MGSNTKLANATLMECGGTGGRDGWTDGRTDGRTDSVTASLGYLLINSKALCGDEMILLFRLGVTSEGATRDGNAVCCDNSRGTVPTRVRSADATSRRPVP
eukprot:2568264-Prymnesium_polylepis.1